MSHPRGEEVVALPLERSCTYVVAALGVLKAGGAYLPIEVNTPDEVLSFLLRDSEARFALTSPAQMQRFEKWDGSAFALNENGECLEPQPEVEVLVPSDPKRRAYVIYTSGSTGQPKGVEIEHHSLTNLVSFFHQWFQLTCEDRTTLIANVAFDASVMELWPCLCAGGSVFIPPQQLLTDLDGLIQWLSNEKITYSAIFPRGGARGPPDS